MKTITGTEYFTSKQSALKYYMIQGYVEMEDIEKKIKDGSIRIGRPIVSDGEELVLLDGGLRYGIKK